MDTQRTYARTLHVQRSIGLNKLAISGKNCVENIIFFFHVCNFIIGFIIMGLGLNASNALKSYDMFLDVILSVGLHILLAIGVIIIFIAFVCCWCTVRESSCSLTMFSFLVILMLLFQISTDASFFFHSEDMLKYTEKALNSTIGTYYNDTVTEKSWDGMQKQLHCCGIYSFKDWENLLNQVSNPPSSCLNGTNSYFQIGCLAVLQQKIADVTSDFEVVSIVFGVIQFVAVVLAWCWTIFAK